MTTVYDEIADYFMSSLAAQTTNITRDEFIARLKERCPTEAEARDFFTVIQIDATQALARAEHKAAKRGNKIVGIAYKLQEGK